ncbi:MAG: glycosyltransferase [Bacteroidales bacterium]|nr:glycosyltransferase [Bacteroidales bacterium]
MYYSVVVPTFSRPDEVKELLDSLVGQDYKEFEVIIADGSPDDTVKNVTVNYNRHLKLQHIHEKGMGISESRNLGVQHAKGDYVVFFDSDCVIPHGYFTTVNKHLSADPVDAYGGPDKADETFSHKQKAISYAMTSFYSTGGIRGRKNHLGRYHPRSFNMGIKRDVFNKVGGSSNLKVSEDIDLSMRLHQEGYSIALIEEAFVFHKRRSTFYKFFRQVFSFGCGRVDLRFRHRNALKFVHLLPALFVVYLLAGFILSFFSRTVLLIWLGSLLAYCILLFTDSYMQNRKIAVAFLSVYAVLIMLKGYGMGMIRTLFARYVAGSRKETEKPEITKGV